MKTINAAAPINSLIGELQDISGVLAAVTAPVVESTEDMRGFPVEAWNHIKRVTALSQGNICPITTPELDRLIIGYTRGGMLITYYQPSIGATIYRRPDGSVLAMSIGGQHFCHRDVRPVKSPTLYVQTIGRSQRKPSKPLVIQWTPDSLPLLDRVGGAGEGASDATARMAMAIAMFTDGINTPDEAK